ncbi:MAG: hypothetical protein ACRC57_07655 [Sarcina sp.]
MKICPFWSVENNEELCNKECPMIKLDDECLFQMYAFEAKDIDIKNTENEELEI